MTCKAARYSGENIADWQYECYFYGRNSHVPVQWYIRKLKLAVNIKYPIILLDASFKSNFCPKDKIKEWDEVIGIVNSHLPSSVEASYHMCPTSAGILEDIGLGQFRAKNKESLTLLQDWQYFCDQKVVESVEPTNKGECQRLYSEAELCTAALYISAVEVHVRQFFYEKLTHEFLSQQAKDKVRQHPYHPYASAIQQDIIDWQDRLSDRIFYEEFIEDLVWDMVFRYPYIVAGQVSDIRAIGLYHAIYHKLAGFFLAFQKAGYNRNGLSLFASIEEFHHLKKNPNAPATNLIRRWDDILDPELAHFSLLGYARAGKRHPVTVLTSEKQGKVEGRLRLLKETLQELSRHGYPIEETPGYVVNFDPEDHTRSYFIDLFKF